MKNVDEFQNQMEIASRLKTIREAKGFTTQNMADLMGVSYITYAKYESGSNGITTKNLIKIRNILHVSIDMLLFGETGMDDFNFEEYIVCAKLFSFDGFDSFKNSIDYIHKLREASQPADAEIEDVETA